MRLIILVCQLVLFMRAEAQIPDACITSPTNRPPENTDITVVCGTEYMDLSIYLCPIYQALYDESLMVVNNQYNNPECFGTVDFTVDPPVLKFRLPLRETAPSSCSNSFKIISPVWDGVFSDFSNVQYVNISGTVTSVDPSAGMITYRPQILYKFSCLYPLQYLLDDTELGVAGVSLAIRDNNGSFISTLSMQLYSDEQYQETLVIPPSGLNLKTKIYVAVVATNLTDRFNVLLDRCYATSSPYPTTGNSYDLFMGCTRDSQTVVTLNGQSQMAHFSFEAFRFVEHKNQGVSTFYLQCVTRLCEVSACSALMPDCSSSPVRKRREAQYVSESATVTSPAIILASSSETDDDYDHDHDGSNDDDNKHNNYDEYSNYDIYYGWPTITYTPSYYVTDKNKYKTDAQVNAVFDGASRLSWYSIPLGAVTVCITTIWFSI